VVVGELSRPRHHSKGPLPAPPLAEYAPVLLDVSLERRIPDAMKVPDLEEIRCSEIVESLSNVRRAVVRRAVAVHNP
jgi:hypothetical protein